MWMMRDEGVADGAIRQDMGSSILLLAPLQTDARLK